MNEHHTRFVIMPWMCSCTPKECGRIRALALNCGSYALCFLRSQPGDDWLALPSEKIPCLA